MRARAAGEKSKAAMREADEGERVEGGGEGGREERGKTTNASRERKTVEGSENSGVTPAVAHEGREKRSGRREGRGGEQE